MEILIGISALVLGVLLGYLLARQRAQSRLAILQQEAAVAANNRAHLEQELRTLQEKFQKLDQEAAELRTDRVRLTAELASEKQRHEEKLAALENLHQKFQDTFKALSSEALRSNNSQFLELARETLSRFQTGAQSDLEKRQTAINTLVKPLQEALLKVDSKVSELEKAREGAYAGLNEQIRSMAEAQTRLQGETANLVQALRTPNVRGQWGEVQLERTVEFAGMVEHVHFVQQESTSTEEGRLRPDMIVNLPNGNRIVVDAKAPLDAYLSALAASDPDEKIRQLQRHARQIRDHIRKLGAKQYWKQFEPAPEFVVLFIPGESFFSAALDQDPDLIEFGSAENVIIATPTTLIALLKAIAYGWRQEQIAAQAKAISDLGRELYERMVVMGGHFEKLGKALERSVESYNQTLRSIDSRVFVSARKFTELAPISDKAIPQLSPIDHTTLQSNAPEWNEPKDETS